MGFKGLIITDALEMKGVSDAEKPGIIELKALMAGNDVLLLPQDIRAAISKIKEAVGTGLITEREITDKCRKVLMYKQIAGLDNYSPPMEKNLSADLESPETNFLIRRLFESSLTLVKNEDSLVPMLNTNGLKIAVLSLGDTNKTKFQERCNSYVNADNFHLASLPSCEEERSLLNDLQPYDYVIAGIHHTKSSLKDNYGLTPELVEFIDSLRITNKVILVVFGSPYILSRFNDTRNIKSILISYQETDETQDCSAQLIFGGIPSLGLLPVTASAEFPFGTGHVYDTSFRFKYTLPEELGIGSQSLKAIDSLALVGIKEHAYPGYQILFARNGKIFYQKSFGTHTYKDSIPVKNDDIYDIASLTKIFATTLAIMKLEEEGKLKLDDPLIKFFPHFRKKDKKHITIRDLLTHQARLVPWIPFFEETMKNGVQDPAIYGVSASDRFPYRVANGMYIRKDYPDKIIQGIFDSKLLPAVGYVYSDLGFYLLMKIVEEVSHKPLEEYVNETFYKPLNLNAIGYHPRNLFDLSRVIPTENDTIFRKQLIHGDVHDPGAAMMGGVGGHAGVFADASDLAVLMQFLLQKGVYGGKRLLKEETVELFTSRQFPGQNNRRGLGFDKPAFSDKEKGPTCDSASDQSFGHSGFTGTYAWADPEFNLVFIFLSNRVNPDAHDNKLARMNLRTRMHQVVYDAIQKGYFR